MSQTIDVEVGPGATSPAALADIEKFETMLASYLQGDLDEDRFRIFRLNNGIYGQRQGGHNQMVRIKVPYGSLRPEQLDMLAHVAEEYSRGWGHITTRQNVQLHFVALERVPELLRQLASVGLTTREACGDTVRNITGCHLAGACPYEVLDISPWAEAAFRHFLRHPYAQRLPRKFKINFSGCVTDCGQAMFNDIGVIAVSRPSADGSVEAGFRVFFAGGLGANPHPAQALEDFTPREELMATLEAILRTFDHYGNRDNKLRARMKWLLDTMGVDELRERILKERRLLVASASWPGGVPDHVARHGDAPAGVSGSLAPTKMGWGTDVVLRRRDPYGRWEEANVVRGNAKGTVSAYAYARLGDVTAEQFRALADIQRELGLEVRVTNRQNVVFRGLTEEQLPALHGRLAAIGMAEPGAELARDVVSCPGADTCNLAVTQSRGLADDIGRALEEAGLADVGGVRVNISGCTNSCGQHHVADIGFVGVERRAHGRPAPGYQMLLGGHIGHAQVEFGRKALRLPAKAAGTATVRVVGRFAEERGPGEAFAEWLERCGGAAAVGAELKDLDVFPPPEENPDFYVDFDETGPYVSEVGVGECAGS
ncbi:MAG: nitrite/sulfite reductase [Actinomycetota bacterium]|nr:nitrite/sulfite reductase [Actinomycetota bacterium]